MPTKLGSNVALALGALPVLWYISYFGNPFFHFLSTLILLLLLAIYCSPRWPDPQMDYVSAALMNKKRFLPPNTPTHLTLVTYYDDCPAYEDVVRCQRVLLQYDRFTSLPVASVSAFESRWLKVNDLKIEDHVKEHILEDDADIEREVEGLTLGVLRPLDPRLPLWRVDILRCSNGKSAVVWLVDHSIGDGLRLLPIVLGYCTNADGSPCILPEFVPKRATKKPALLNVVLTGIRDLVDVVMTPTGRFDTICSINKNAQKPSLDYDGKRAIAHTECSLSDINDIRKAAGPDITVNDVLTACWGGTLRRYMEKENDSALKLPQLLLRGQAPAAFPHPTVPGKVFVKMAFVVFHFPVHLPTVTERLRFVNKEWTSLKNSPKIALTDLVASSTLKLGLDNLLIDVNRKLWHRTSFVFSNVPGPREPIYMFGKKVVALRPYYCNLLHQVIFFSYNGNVSLSMVLDTNYLKADQLISCFHEELEVMKREILNK